MRKKYGTILLSLVFILGLVAIFGRRVYSQDRTPEIIMTINGQQGSITVPPGATVSMSYNTNYADSCYGVGIWGAGPKPLSGAAYFSSIQSDVSYELWCQNSSATVYKSIQVTVSNQPPPPPNTPWVDLRVNGGNQAYLQSGGSITLSWTSNMVSSCVASQSWGGQRGTSGQAGIGNITSSRNYDLTCTGSNGVSVSDRVSVIVNPPATLPPGSFPSPTAALSPSPSGVPNCQLSFSPGSLNVSVGQRILVSANVINRQSCTLDQIRYTSTNTSIASTTAADNSAPFTADVVAEGQGAAIITATGYINNQPTGSVTLNVNVGPAHAWWQVEEGDVTTNGNIFSLRSPACITPACRPFFNVENPGGQPGVVSYGGSQYDFLNDQSLGDVSSHGWLANTSYMGQNYSVNYFTDFLTSDLAINNISGSIRNIDLNSGSASGGYYWYRVNGNASIDQIITIPNDRKVVLIVEGGDLNINNPIRVNNSENSFFLALIEGNIVVNAAVGSSTQPSIEGLYFTDEQFRSGASDTFLWIKGAVSALSGFSLQRDLGDNNADTPAEFIEYDPNLVLQFPSQLIKNQIIWKEVSP